jgi:hypothetical protein
VAVSTPTPTETTTALAEALVARDPDALSGLLAPDARFFSPAFADPVTGRDAVTGVLAAASRVYADLRFDDPRADGSETVTFFTATVPHPDGGTPVALDGCYRTVVDEDGRVRDLTAYFRPLPALQALVAAVMAARTAAGS